MITVSEGFVAVSDVRRRLAGYATEYLLVEPLDRGTMGALYAEYSGLHGCRLPLSEYWGVYGGAPGYLPGACWLEPRALLEKALDLLRDVVDAALDAVALEMGAGAPRGSRGGGGPRREALRWWCGGARAEGAEARRDTGRAQRVLPVQAARLGGAQGGFIPWLPLYAAALFAAREAGLDETSRPPLSLLRDWLRRRDWQVRCREMRGALR